MVEANVLHQNRRCHLAETIIQLEIATVKVKLALGLFDAESSGRK